MLRAVSRGLAARASATPLGGGESSARFLPARVWRPHGETMRTASADATATSSADGPAMPGWMGRPATDARADDEDEYFPARTPADDDRAHFRESPSVAFWNAWRFDESDGARGVRSLLEQITAATKTPFDARYWAYHIFRSSWFLGQGAAGLLASAAVGTGAVGNPLSGDGGVRAGVAAGARLFAEAVQVYAQDLAHVNAGTYRAPYDMTELRHRQYDPMFVAKKTARFISEASSTLRKNTRARTDPDADPNATKVWMDSPMYPDYYLKTFHWQTDGWFSRRSAEVYEVSTETLFLGRQDAMQRTALVPLSEWTRETGASRDGEGTKLLELACGTGRFLTFVRDNYPKMDVTGLDLSPFYLAEARDNAEYWEKLRRGGETATRPDPVSVVADAARRARGTGESRRRSPLPPFPAAPPAETETGSAKTTGSCDFVQANAESMPFSDATFDAVTCVYLLHELPPAARRRWRRRRRECSNPGASWCWRIPSSSATGRTWTGTSVASGISTSRTTEATSARNWSRSSVPTARGSNRGPRNCARAPRWCPSVSPRARETSARIPRIPRLESKIARVRPRAHPRRPSASRPREVVTLAARESHPGTRRETRGGVRDAVLAARRSPPEITLLAFSPPRDARAHALVRRFRVARARPGRRRGSVSGRPSERGGTLRPARVGVRSTAHAHGVPRLVVARRATREEFILEGGRGRPRRERNEPRASQERRRGPRATARGQARRRRRGSGGG